MSKADEMFRELKEAKIIFYCFTKISNINVIDEQGFENIKKAMNTVLNYIENSIPKQLIEERIRNLNNQIITLEDKYYKCKDLKEKQINIDTREKIYDEIEILEKLLEGK